jgi:hypothetical protein
MGCTVISHSELHEQVLLEKHLLLTIFSFHQRGEKKSSPLFVFPKRAVKPFDTKPDLSPMVGIKKYFRQRNAHKGEGFIHKTNTRRSYDQQASFEELTRDREVA